jgi:uncharacterized protein YlxW (UPF0749 family)
MPSVKISGSALFIGFLVIAALTALTVALVVTHADATRAIHSLQHRNAALGQQVSSLSQEVGNLNDSVGSLTNTVAGISRPTDPLSAYTEVCYQYFTNPTTDVNQPYWFPCTNNAQTIPQPGN